MPLVIGLLCIGCGSQRIAIAAESSGQELLFTFATGFRQHSAPKAKAIEVIEFENARRGKVVCKLLRPMGSGYAPLEKWRYGDTIDGYDLLSCQALKPNLPYALRVFVPGREGMILFILDEKRAVRVLPNWRCATAQGCPE